MEDLAQKKEIPNAEEVNIRPLDMKGIFNLKLALGGFLFNLEPQTDTNNFGPLASFFLPVQNPTFFPFWLLSIVFLHKVTGHISLILHRTKNKTIYFL